MPGSLIHYLYHFNIILESQVNLKDLNCLTVWTVKYCLFSMIYYTATKSDTKVEGRCMAM